LTSYFRRFIRRQHSNFEKTLWILSVSNKKCVTHSLTPKIIFEYAELRRITGPYALSSLKSSLKTRKYTAAVDIIIECAVENPLQRS
jgi:hypothetical protein